MFILMDYHAGLILLPKDFYEEYQEEIRTKLKNFIFHTKSDEFVSIQSTRKLPNKFQTKLFYKGEEKEASTCNFCEKRVKCSTNGWQCSGYKQAKPFENDLNDFVDYLNSFSNIIFTKVE